jgi:hypothetical protein
MRLYCTLGPPLEKVILSAAVLPSHSTRHLAVDGLTSKQEVMTGVALSRKSVLTLLTGPSPFLVGFLIDLGHEKRRRATTDPGHGSQSSDETSCLPRNRH